MISTYGAIIVYCDPFPGALVWYRLDLNVCFSNFITQDTKDTHSYFFSLPQLGTSHYLISIGRKLSLRYMQHPTLELPLGLLSKLLESTLLCAVDQELVTLVLVLLCALSEVAVIADEQHVLGELLGDFVSELRGRLDGQGLLDELDGLAGHGGQGVGDVLGVHPLAGALDGEAVGALAGLEQPDREQARVVADVDHGQPRRRCAPRQCERRRPVLGWLDLRRQVRHEIRRHEVRHDQVAALDLLRVLLHPGFGVEVLDLAELPVGELLRVRETAPHQVLDAL